MKDPRVNRVARNLLSHSVRLQPGEKILVQASVEAKPLVKELLKEIYALGALPFVQLTDSQISRELLMGVSEEQLKLMAEFDLVRMKAMDAYISISALTNSTYLADVPQAKKMLHSELYTVPVHFKERIENTKWVITTYPTDSMAQAANMSYDAYEDFYFNTSCLDYSKMDKAMDPLVDILQLTDVVRITGQGTNISFSIKGMPAIKCSGQVNIPDGEVYTAPILDSVNGVISYNTPAVYMGKTFENIRLEFKDGKIIDASANNTEDINRIFDTDTGARYIGEFAIGVNPYIVNPMKNTLFDEKICGSFHFTPGSAYTECDNGNDSAVHWDLVCIQRPDFGGGEMWFDNKLVRKDGIFIIDELKPLNPENLK
ncbi:MAG: aminopeptidase [Bacillota bacterium]